MDAATLVVVFLLVTLASLAAYLLSQWSFIRNGNISIMGWLAISVGTTLLLGAAAIVLLTSGLLPKLPLLPDPEWATQMRKSTRLDSEIADRARDLREAPTDASTAAIRSAAPSDRGVSPAKDQFDDRSGPAAPSALSSQQRSGSSQEAKNSAASSNASPVFTAVDPWAATRCVYAINLARDANRWRIENECGAPVAVVLATCSEGPPECSRWQYEVDGMILPGRAQRAVTSAEEIRDGAQIRYVACMLASPLAIELIGQSREIRSSPSWLEQFEAARDNDECLRLVQRWSDVGRASGQSIDVLFGAKVPGNVHSAAALEP